MSGQHRVEVGRIARAQGLRGEVRVTLHNPDSDILETVERVWLRLPGRSEVSYRVRGRRLAGRQIILALEGVTDRTGAEALTGARLLVPRAWLPALEEEEYYHADIPGLAVEDSSGRPVGTVVDVFPGGAHDIFEIDGLNGRRWLVPAVARYVVRVDVTGGKVVVHHLEDLDAFDAGGSAGAV